MEVVYPLVNPTAHVCPRFRSTRMASTLQILVVTCVFIGGEKVVDESEFELFDVNHQKSGAFLCGSPGFHFCAGSPAVCALVGGAEVDSNNWVELNEIALRNGSHNLFQLESRLTKKSWEHLMVALGKSAPDSPLKCRKNHLPPGFICVDFLFCFF